MKAPRTALVIFLSLLCIGYVDYRTGYEVGLSFFYLLPLAAAGSLLPRSLAVAFAMVATAIWVLADFAGGHVHLATGIRIWNACNRMGIFVGAVLAASSLAATIMQQKTTITALRGALLTANDLSAHIPICNVCGSHRDDEACQAGLRGFLQELPDPRIVGRPCPTCLDERRRKIEEGIATFSPAQAGAVPLQSGARSESV